MKATALFLSLIPCLALATEPLVVHEWGTFTVLQDELGNPVDGVNINEESLPPFVHNLSPNLTPDSHELGPLIGLGQFAPTRSKGISRSYFAARMRMETPIIYLYPPGDQPQQPIDVHVSFNGGWITEWYPNASIVAPGHKPYMPRLSKTLTPSTTGTILWDDIKFVPEKQIQTTDFPVWIAPRETAAPTVSTPQGEAERYLFYRGVANLEAPLRVVRQNDNLAVQLNDKSTCPIENFDGIALWLVEINPDGVLQYRRVNAESDDPRPGQTLATVPMTFKQTDVDGHASLRSEMMSELIDQGLFQDEAEAMLNTWEVSYFQTSGLRLFFTLPQEWTDRVLPLKTTGYAETKQVRAMIGRIELISDNQRKLLSQIMEGPVSDSSWFTEALLKDGQAEATSRHAALVTGQATLEEFGMIPPKDYQAYMDLGRFRDPLVLHAIKHPSQPVSPVGCVKVDETRIEVRHPAAASGKVSSFTITVPGHNRIINLGEMEVYRGGDNVASQAKLVQSSNYQERFPIANLVDGDKNNMSHTYPESNPWINVEFAEPISIDEVVIWNRQDGFQDRFDGAQITFNVVGSKDLEPIKIRTAGPETLRTFARNYRLPL